MSRTKLSPKVVLEVWLRAAGRCQYPGCNIPLWQDELTLQKMNRAYLAHIVADEPGGPRGDPILSELLKNDPGNIMLLCDTHHRLIDKVDVAGHPVDLLTKRKAEHEERIVRQTEAQNNRRTHILMLGTRIGDRQGLVNYDQARDAIFPERYPATEAGIRIDFTHVLVNEQDSEYWQTILKYIDRMLALHLTEDVGPSGKPLNHLSVFALAPMPVLIYFGKQLGDIVSADVYQRHRDTGDWRWKGLNEEQFDYIIHPPLEANAKSDAVAVNLSLSGSVKQTEIDRAMARSVPTYTVRIKKPNRNYLKAKEQLELFRNEWYQLLSEIREKHGENCELHLFPAVPVAVAVEIGRSLLPKSDPRLVVYDRNQMGFQRTITV